MRSALRACAILACLALGFLRHAPAASPDSEGTAARLVRKALEAKLRGSSDDRARLLAEALAIDPNFEPARWQSGYLRIGGEWIKLDDVPKRFGGDPQLSAYRKLRDGMVDTADNHRELARWCHKNRLLDLERVHWAKVLEFERQDAEALTALGLELYDGRLLTRSQIEKARISAGERLTAMRQWQPQLLKWRRAIEGSGDKQRKAALESLGKLGDPAVLGALESVFPVDRVGDKVIAENRALLEAVGRMAVPEATLFLLRRSVLGEPDDVRELAIEQLKKRPLHAYVPQLIAALPGSIQTQFQIFMLPGGLVVHEHNVLFEGRKANTSLSSTSVVNVEDPAGTQFSSTRAANKELSKAQQIEAQARAAQQQLAQLRDRVHNVLRCATGFDGTSDPESWQKLYDDYNGRYAQAVEKPTFPYSTYEFRGYAWFPAPVRTNVAETTANWGEGVTYIDREQYGNSIINGSCFPAGTQVMTMVGQRPIESLKIGDRVLAQDIASGELAYKPLQGTTLRPSIALTAIRLDKESVLATPGHPFWVIGEGWRMARQLQPGQRLRTVQGASEITSVETTREQEAYNLVVSDFHTYFVAESKLLVHDNAPLEEQPQRVPGLATTEP